MSDIESLLQDDAVVWQQDVDSRNARLSGKHSSAGSTVEEAMAVRTDRPAPFFFRTKRNQRHRLAAWITAAAIVALVGVISVVALSKSNSPARTHPGGDGARVLPTPGSVDPKTATSSGSSPGNFVSLSRLSTQQASTGISMPWVLVSSSTANPALYIRYVAGDGSCVDSAGYLLEESDQQVLLEVLSQQQDQPSATAANAATGCGDNLVTNEARIPLGAPLGDRTLIHATVDSQWVGTQRYLIHS